MRWSIEIDFSIEADAKIYVFGQRTANKQHFMPIFNIYLYVNTKLNKN